MLKNKKEAVLVMREAAMLLTEIAEYFYYQEYPDERPENEEPSPDNKPQAPEVTLEDVREVLASLSHAGKTALVKQLLNGFGAAKLSEVNPKDYWVLMAQAQEAQNAG